MRTVGVRLDPLDTLFFRDARPFDAAIRASGQLPYPQPLAGAMRTALLARHGFNFADFSARRRRNPREEERAALEALGAPRNILDLHFRGPWLALANGNHAEPLLPVPLTLTRDEKKKEWYRSDPLKDIPPGWSDPDSLRPLWRKEGRDAKHPGGFLTPEGIGKFLAGGVPKDEDWLKSEDLYAFDHRTGIKIDPNSLTAAEGQIYGISLLALRPNVKRKGIPEDTALCLYAEVLTDSNPTVPDLLPLGGEGRYVRAKAVPAVAWPEAVEGKQNLWLLATPAFFPVGQPLPKVGSAQLKAAASGPPLAYSGWDVARGGTRPTRFAVPAGSVYFVEGDFAPKEESLCVAEEDVAQGWGFVLRGVWQNA